MFLFKKLCRLGLLGLVTASPAVAATTVLTPVYFSSSTDRLSSLRFFNSGTTSGVATVKVRDGAGAVLGTWQKQIPAGTALQFGVDLIERESGIAPTGVGRLEIKPTFAGCAQHVVYNPKGGALTNVSTCAADLVAEATSLSSVHSSLFTTFPSRIVVQNKGTAGAADALGSFALTGTGINVFGTKKN